MKKQKNTTHWRSKTLDEWNKKIKEKQRARAERRQAREAAAVHQLARPITPEMESQPGFHNLTGSEFGFGSKVICLSQTSKKWLCRCVCGGEFKRGTITIVKSSIDGCVGDGADFCESCVSIASSKIIQMKEQLGRFVTEKEKRTIYEEIGRQYLR